MSHEEMLNEWFANMESDEVFERFLYLTNPHRGNCISEQELWSRITWLGTTLKEYDPIIFEGCKQDF